MSLSAEVRSTRAKPRCSIWIAARRLERSQVQKCCRTVGSSEGVPHEVGTLDPSLLETETLYFGTLAAFQYDGPNGLLWKKWDRSLKARLLPQQRIKKGECERGSWDGQGFRGRLQATALNGLNFEFYHR